MTQPANTDTQPDYKQVEYLVSALFALPERPEHIRFSLSASDGVSFVWCDTRYRVRVLAGSVVVTLDDNKKHTSVNNPACTLLAHIIRAAYLNEFFTDRSPSAYPATEPASA